MPLKFRKVLIATETFESAGVFDVNGNGTLDIVSGAWWYEGPDFEKRHYIGEVAKHGEYFDDFSTIPLDINGNGNLDFVTGGWWGDSIRWRENPGESDSKWPEHVIAHCGNVETTRAWDVDGDGTLEIVPNTPKGPLKVYKLNRDQSGKSLGGFTVHTIWPEPQGHGLGFGDITGNGRGDFILAHGWLEAPPNPWEDPWIYHADFDLGSASIPILVQDVTGNGRNDLIVGQSHAYGLDWWEQMLDASGKRSWKKHQIDPYNSQYHDLHWADLDGDGESELITGKRYRAHCGRDPGAEDDAGIYYFKWNGESFTKLPIYFGAAKEGNGFGIHAVLADLQGRGCLDIVAPGKDGLYVFYNEG